MVYLQYVIENNAREIERLYNETQIIGEITPDPESFRIDLGSMGNFITQTLVNQLMSSEYISRVYFEAGEHRTRLIPFPEVTDEIRAMMGQWDPEWMLAPSCFDTFVENNGPQARDAFDIRAASGNMWAGEFSLTLADGFALDDFVYTDNQPTPIILHQHVMRMMWLQLGDTAHIASAGRINEAVVVGHYTGGHISGVARYDRGMLLLPPGGIHALRGENINYVFVRFYIDPRFNREIPEFRMYLNRLLMVPGSNVAFINVDINDDIIRFVIEPLERNLELLHLLFPVVLIVVTILAGGFAILLLIQNSKNAAIMRSLGASKNHVRAALCLEYLTACIIGGLLCFVAVPLMNINLAGAVPLLGLYFAGAITGAIVGVIVITRKSPLDLLQVRE
jgi:hypothetical protein